MKIKILIIISIIILVALFILFSWLPFSTPFGKVISSVKTKEKLVALTFDDGPGENTQEIINILEKNNISATFFVVGQQVKLNESIIQNIKEKRFEIGVHTMTHPFLYHKNYEILKSKNYIESITNTTINLFRPPYGLRTPTTIKISKEANLQIILWDVFPRDYKANKEKIVKRVLRNVKPGSIICLHDGPENRNETVKALPEIIEKLQELNYSFVTVNELISSASSSTT